MTGRSRMVPAFPPDGLGAGDRPQDRKGPFDQRNQLTILRCCGTDRRNQGTVPVKN